MRVLMVNDLPIESGWGAEAHVGRLAAALEATGDDVDIFAGEITHRGAGKALDLWDPRARRALRERAERFGPDVVHHHNVLRELSVSVLGVPSGVPTVMTVHEHRLLGVPDRPQRGVREFVTIPLSGFQRRVVRRRVDLVIGVSRHMTSKLEAAGFPRVAHVPQFAALPPASVRERPVDDATDVVVASRLSREKGIPVLVEAFARIADRHEGTRLIVAGDGPEAKVVSGL
jgi:glycosyltransferase involved in cell wall biosynthesis